jgi:transcriptional antiterminator RfaH
MNAAVPVEVLAPSWHVVQSKPRMEQRAKENLENQGFEVFLPMLDIQKVRRGKLQTVTEPLFSRYMFLRLTEQMQDLSVVRSSKGVSHLVRFGTMPAKVPDAWVQGMRQQPAATAQKMFKTGDAVLVADGPLKGLEAVYLEENGEARAMILINLLSKPHSLVFDVAHLLPTN